MADIADTSESAIIRPGLKPCWLFVGSLNAPEVNYYARELAKKSNAFGADIQLVESDSTRCCGAIVVTEFGCQMTRAAWLEVRYFLDRDGDEANVFVFDRFQKNFGRRGRAFFLRRLI